MARSLAAVSASLATRVGRVGKGLQATVTARMSGLQGAWLESVARLHGLIDPLTVSPTARTDGTVVQTVSEVGAVVTVTTTAAPSGAVETSALTAQQALWLERLARIHGLVDPLTVTTTARGDGTVQQTIETTGATTVVTLQ